MENQDHRLLVVDDNEMNRDMLSRRLQRKGYTVLVAEDGEKALDTIGKEEVDLVLLDIMMPGLDGVEVLKILRKDYSQTDLPVIMATAKADSKDMVEALSQGANDYVTKPLDFPVVLARVEAQLRTKAAASAPKTGEPTAAEIEPGVVVAGKYRLQELIGEGTFGAVYKAEHVDLEQEVAVKVLQPSVTSNDESLKRFRQEGVAACRVRHPNAVAVSDFGVTDTGVAYLVMELLKGLSLADELSKNHSLSPHRCLEVLGPVCDVMAEAHATHLVHRDLKPENIFLHQSARGEEVKVLDFGIAKLVGEAVTAENLTAEGWVLGTPAYMAPERISPDDLDGQADVYSLGIMLFEMLTGSRPFAAENRDPMSIIMMHVNVEPPTLRSIAPEVPEVLEEVVAGAIRKEPEDRPTAGELGAALKRAVESLGDAEPEPSPVPSRAVEPPASNPSTMVDRQAPTVALGPASSSTSEGGGFFGRLLKKLKRS